MSRIDRRRRRLLELAGGGAAVALAGRIGEAADAATGGTTDAETDTMTHDGHDHDDTTTESDGSNEAAARAVFHFSGAPAEQNHALANVENLLADGTVDLDDVILVANGAGIELVLEGKSRVPDRLDSLVVRGVAFAACHNSLEGRDLTEKDLLDGVEVVPAGVGELTKRQCAGYAYIKTP